MYQNGYGVTKNLKKAIEFYEKSANQGYADAQKNLGWMYAEWLHGVTKNLIKAFEFYEKSANKGYADAQKSWIYKKDIQDYKLASWYNKAAQGNKLLGWFYICQWLWCS